MERVAFLIEDTNTRISCLLNPVDWQDGFIMERRSGAARLEDGALMNTDASDSPVVFRNRGDTRLMLKLMFDVSLSGSSIQVVDVRELTRPLWEMAEYVTQSRRNAELPRVRFIWGRAWNIPVVVDAIAERFERFTSQGIPQRSWMSLRLLRTAEAAIPELPGPGIPSSVQVKMAESLPAEDHTWGVHELLGGGVEGERLDQLAERYYGDAGLWRVIAAANNIDDPSAMPAGTLLRIPPPALLPARSAARRRV